jgi:hypothetical protein
MTPNPGSISSAPVSSVYSRDSLNRQEIPMKKYLALAVLALALGFGAANLTTTPIRTAMATCGNGPC